MNSFRDFVKMHNFRNMLIRRNFCEISNVQSEEQATVPKPKSQVSLKASKSHKIKIKKFFERNAELAKIKQHIPEKYLLLKRVTPPENLYLIDSTIAETAVKHVFPEIEKNPNQTVCETNVGLGLITSELLKKGVNFVRIYESCALFKDYLMGKLQEYIHRIEVFNKDIFFLPRYDYIDKQDHGNRVEQLLKGVQRKNWKDDPTMTIIGSLSNRSIFRFLMKSLALQSFTTSLGRIQFFVFMHPKDYIVLAAGPHLNLHTYLKTSVLFQLLFDFELLEKFPRNVFLPWHSPKRSKVVRYADQIDTDSMYFVKINFKKELPVTPDNLLALYAFVDFFGRGTTKVVPYLEKWVPGCGLDLMVPKLLHDNYFEDLNIFTKFGELTPNQILAVYQEVTSHPEYEKSHFMNLVESHLIKTETTESSLDIHLTEKNTENEQDSSRE